LYKGVIGYKDIRDNGINGKKGTFEKIRPEYFTRQIQKAHEENDSLYKFISRPDWTKRCDDGSNKTIKHEFGTGDEFSIALDSFRSKYSNWCNYFDEKEYKIDKKSNALKLKSLTIEQRNQCIYCKKIARGRPTKCCDHYNNATGRTKKDFIIGIRITSSKKTNQSIAHLIDCLIIETTITKKIIN
jgi:hypothetical protein